MKRNQTKLKTMFLFVIGGLLQSSMVLQMVSSFAPSLSSPQQQYHHRQQQRNVRSCIRIRNRGQILRNNRQTGAEMPKKWIPPTTTSLPSSDDEFALPAPPTSFRESEILGLRLMQEERYADALLAFTKGMKLPGSKCDIVRTKNVSGPSPVGGSHGGTEGKEVWTLDEFEYQAAYYNMACACAKLGEIEEAVVNLRNAYDNGFDNYGAITSDPDLEAVQDSDDFKAFLEEVNPKKKGLFGFM